MGSTFSLTLFRKIGPLPVMKKGVIEALEAMGYTKTTASNPDALAISIYSPRRSSWIALNIPASLSDDEDFIRRLSLHLGTPALTYFSFDSDLISLRLTDGEQIQFIHCGAAADSLPEPPVTEEALALFDTLLTDEASRASFREIIQQKPDFSEEIADRLAPLLGYPEALVYTDELHDPSAVLYFRQPDEPFSFLLPETDPPAFHTHGMYTSHSNPTHLSVRPCGGKGRGVRLSIIAREYNPDEWHVPTVALRRGPFEMHEHSADEYTFAAPIPCTFADGSEGWYADFPDVEIAPGVIYEPLTQRKIQYLEKTCLTVHIPFCGGKFHHDYYSAHCTPEALGGKNLLILAPLENPNGAARTVVPRHPFEKTPLHEAWLGTLADEYK